MMARIAPRQRETERSPSALAPATVRLPSAIFRALSETMGSIRCGFREGDSPAHPRVLDGRGRRRLGTGRLDGDVRPSPAGHVHDPGGDVLFVDVDRDIGTERRPSLEPLSDACR